MQGMHLLTKHPVCLQKPLIDSSKRYLNRLLMIRLCVEKLTQFRSAPLSWFLN